MYFFFAVPTIALVLIMLLQLKSLFQKKYPPMLEQIENSRFERMYENARTQSEVITKAHTV